MKRDLLFKIMIGVQLLSVLIIVIVFYPTKTYSNRSKVVICLNKDNDFEKKSREEQDIILEDCRDSLIDYNKEKQAVLYVNYGNEIVEKNINTGTVQKIDIINNFRETLNLQEEEYIYNLQYGPGEHEITFAIDNYLYSYNFLEDQVGTIMNCLSSSWCNSYQWENSNLLYFTIPKDDEGVRWVLYSWDRIKQETIEIDNAVRSFILSDDKKKLYGIRLFSKFNGISMEMSHKIVEWNMENGTSRILQESKSEENFILHSVDDKFLIYIDQSSYKKNCKVYCLNLESGKRKCIYRTDKRIVGIIEK